MLFSSLVFLWYFLPAVFLLYFITKNLHIRNGVLLAASLFFYAWGEPKYVILMLVSIGHESSFLINFITKRHKKSLYSK